MLRNIVITITTHVTATFMMNKNLKKAISVIKRKICSLKTT